MALANVTLLIGVAFVAIPIVLHLVMRQQPKKLVFPALRFVQQRRETNRRKLRLRHWLLLLLRCLAIGLLAAALARPSVPSAQLGNWITIALLAGLLLVLLILVAMCVLQQKGRWWIAGLSSCTALVAVGLLVFVWRAVGSDTGVLLGDQEAPVAAVMAIDTSPRMQYRLANRTRLQEAQQTGAWLINQLPPDSEVAVVDSRPEPSAFAVDLSAAAKALQRLQVTAAARPFTQAVQEAIQLARGNPKSRKELYIFTDLTEAAWSEASQGALRAALEEAEEILVYVIDVGVEQPSNFALGPLSLSSQVMAKEADLQIRTEVRAVGTAGSRSVELYVEQPDSEKPVIRDGQVLLPTPRRRSQKMVDLADDQLQAVQFSLRGLDLGVHHGWVKINGEDGLEVDDIRYFTVQVQEAWPVLVVAPDDVWTRFVIESLSPYELRQTGKARFECSEVRQADLENYQLEDYAAVCLLDPQPLTPAAWERLEKYVRQGGGLALMLGHHARPMAAFNDESAQRLLPGPLLRQWRAGGRDLFLDPQNLNHPITAVFRDMPTSTPWNRFPVLRHWDVNPRDSASVVIRFGNRRPALLQQAVGDGKVLTMTTPLSEPARPPGRQPWNELASGENNWPPFVLVNEMMLFLVESRRLQLNYVTGQTAVLPNHDRDPQRYQMFTPASELQDVTAREGNLVVRFTESPGAYRLKGNRGGVVIRGFSANLPAEASDLTRTTRARVDEVLGDQRYQFAQDREEIQRVQGRQRVGREFYPLLIVMLAVVLGLEYTLANRFYRHQPTASGVHPPT